MDELTLELELYQIRYGMWRQSYISSVTASKMSKVRDYFALNDMVFEEEEGVFKVTSPFLKTAVRELSTELQIKFVKQKARLVE